ncbi:coiled-coil domain-containing protein 12 [Galendromus occidentalis]|uniref:Coiled-coil domain-containing protein 12 n=1 Tax=Galendromus occidentalis TaxID=34638 RepID=A0AAJ6QM11_9ACAR|nr:coiled-coil domain-containing protein 12 [Galendromus occidentalis]
MASKEDGAPAQTSENVGKLEENALKRKERLRQLREQRKRKIDPEHDNSQASEALPKPVFRTYRPNDENLQDLQIPDAQPERIEDKVKETLSQEASVDLLDKEIDITTLAPLKPDWDLKRDIAGKLDKLGRRTKRAVAELIRERLRENKEDLARVVQNVQPDADVDDDDDDD